MQHVKSSQSLRDGEAVIEFVVDDEVGRRPVLRVSGWVPARKVVEVVPEGAVEVVLHEPEFFGGVLGKGVEGAVVREDGFEFAA